MKRLMCVALLVVGGCTATNNQVQKSEAQSKSLNPIEEWVQSSLERGVFYKIDVQHNKVWMKAWIWNLESGEAKQKSIILLSQYFESKNGVKLVTIYDRHSDKKLGEYAQFGQIQIYE
ncbi:hypothetical protein ES705_13975 [subsurface metagenome]